ncbi:MAG: c-type cytochrome [Terracidiphilus sp.]|jgi:cytochrome c2
MMRFLILTIASVTLAASPAAMPALAADSILHAHRSSTGDLEVGGALAGLPSGSTRFIRYEDLLRLPQESYTVTDDSNFHGSTQIAGVALDTLARMLGKTPDDALIVAICYDKYRTNYPRDYVAAHHPVLVLRINGQLRNRWPRSKDGGPLGPYLISHPFFKPSFKILSHDDEPQIPYGVTRIEMRQESVVFGAIRPRGQWPADSRVGQGYVIARQDCFRCHNMGAEGGTMAGRSWLKLAARAKEDGVTFRQTIRDPKSLNPDAKMPAHSDYNDATLDALTAYFKTFVQAGRKE